MDPNIVEAPVKTIELKDLSTAAHTWRVVLYTRALAEQFGLDAARLKSVIEKDREFQLLNQRGLFTQP